MTTTASPTRRPMNSAAPEEDWRQYAACQDADDADLWFPVGTSTFARRQEAQAKAVCGRCPVQTECLSWALDSGQGTGIWGGLSEAERRGLGRPQETQVERCLNQQDRMEELLAGKVTHRKVAEELGVGHHAIRRTLKVLEAERAATATAEVA